MFLPCSSASSGDGEPLREGKVMQGRQESAAGMGANDTHLRRGGVEYKAHMCMQHCHQLLREMPAF